MIEVSNERKVMGVKYQLIIFDLDGTILNTLDDLAAAANFALRANGMPEHSTDDVRRFVGNGVEKLIRRAVPAGTPEAVIIKTLGDFKAYYNAHSNDNTRPYPGIRELMTALRRAGAKVAVHSNKYDSAVKQLCELHFPGLIDCSAGEGALSPKKPDPAGALKLMRECGAGKDETVYIGDSEVDLLTAANAGLDVLWVSWGFRHVEEIGISNQIRRFDRPEALEAYLIG